MPIFTDQCVNRDVILALREAGFEVIPAQEVKLSSATDSNIFDYALRNNYTLLTFDKDFGNILRFDIVKSPGVVIVYIEELNKEETVKYTVNFFQRLTEPNLKGKLFIIERDKIRVWPK